MKTKKDNNGSMIPSLMGPTALWQSLIRGPVRILAEVGELSILAIQVIFWMIRPPLRLKVYLEALYFTGVGSIFIVFIVSAFIGAVMSLQTVIGFEMFDAEAMTGGVIALSFTMELSPVFTALLLTARAGSAMATELGTMRVTDQIDALTTMGINPVQYLITPRVIACTIMGPLLCIFFSFVGIAASYVICVIMLNLDPGIFQAKVADWVDPIDVYTGLVKALVLGFVVSLIACRQGFSATGGAAGVGNATTRAVVHGFVIIFIIDYILTSLLQV